MGPAKTRGRMPGRSPHRPAPQRVNPLRRRLRPLLAVAAALLAGVLAVLLLPGVLGGGDPVEERVAELRGQERERDAGLTRELVTTAEQVRAEVVPVLAELEEAVAGEAAGTAADVAAWRRAVQAAAEPLRERPSGGTEVNLARAGLAGAVTALGRAVDTYAASLEASGELRERLRGLAGELREDAVAAWSVAANQLDVAGIAAGLGHVHVFLGEPHAEHGGP